MKITIDLELHDSVALEAISQWAGPQVSAGQLVGACIARAHHDLVRSGTLAPLPSRPADDSIVLVPLRLLRLRY